MRFRECTSFVSKTTLTRLALLFARCVSYCCDKLLSTPTRKSISPADFLINWGGFYFRINFEKTNLSLLPPQLQRVKRLLAYRLPQLQLPTD